MVVTGGGGDYDRRCGLCGRSAKGDVNVMLFNGLEVPASKDPDGILGWLKQHHPTLFNLAFLTDETWSAIIFDDTDPHTISWHVAVRAKNGDLIAQMICEALNLLSSNHCKHALEAGV
jgi:hypothetical protein